ncbi:coiled-coil domain-containing protein 138 isoform X1 [Falco peregrinus]|uniref:coiled-coil domain-containing protein 138 isoform X1 n=1 Tax=Falco peregrinus TaxID=8954 RepID=UPI0024798227|nr:coiled-coil domain-containing protein 138 isoform X1 [Falco peregrinus]XP_055658461.1 coiled-coil domain-containing protein 138 isoform X1 [Falco peregrinus]XP_055658462.1 coiled-coil domain-containing protein 138 isoform X1 [Falco peregrinus]
MDSLLENTTVSLSRCSLESEFTESGREKSIRSSGDFLQTYKDWDCFDGEQDSFCGSSGLEIEEKTINCTETDVIQSTAIYVKTGGTLPSHLAANIQENSGQNITNCLVRKIVSGTDAQACDSKSLIPPHISQIYDELLVILQKLQRESSAQQKYALQLQKRECFLTEREALLFRREAALAKIKGVEEEVHTKFGIVEEQHKAEVKQLTEALREITKENRRLKSSFHTLKKMNDSLKKQLNDVTELNKKLEGQARKVQARLENLQRKHEFLVVQKSKDICQVVQQRKPVKQAKAMVTSKIAKLPLNSQVYELLAFLMDWISDEHLSKIKIQEEREDSHKLLVTQTSKKVCIQESCMKLLPIATEQLQWMPFVNPKLHIPVIRFIYWSIRQLDAGIQHATMKSTMRRLGEDIFKGIVSKGNPHSSSEQSTESKSKSAAFFKSSCMPLRFLSTLIVLKTVTQVDYLAQAFDSLCIDLKTDEGKALFLEYQCVPVILSHLKVSSRGLLSSALDGLLQMTMESDKNHSLPFRTEEGKGLLLFLTYVLLFCSLQPFLEACSHESFFRACSVLLRSSKLDIQILEKLCVILQKLSKIKSNKKMFELFALHQMIQELHRATNPDHAFLCINLNSILLNLGSLRSNSLTSSLSTSH